MMEIRRNDDETLDEVVSPAVKDFHLEQMGPSHWWLGFVADGKLWHINFYSKRGKVNARIEAQGPT